MQNEHTFIRYLLFLLLIISLSGCRSYSSENLPKGLVADSIIPEKEMIGIMADVHVLEAALQMERNKNHDIRPIQDFYYTRLFSKYKISEKRFRKNISFYQGDPEQFKKMYDQVVEILDSRKKTLKN
ncbi:MAG: DUF4296 domain-containing protein [Bacteroidetes bacterium]|nr:DUF4296 domain-containing protein [Bacteroidota bacterium]